MDATLQLSMSADVAVTGKRTFRNMADLDRPEGGLIGIADSASEGLVTGRQIDARPIMRAGEVLETVPGLIISQHSGEGKANQYYLRGFNLDHGTDFTTTVAGVPVNMPTHAPRPWLLRSELPDSRAGQRRAVPQGAVLRRRGRFRHCRRRTHPLRQRARPADRPRRAAARTAGAAFWRPLLPRPARDGCSAAARSQPQRRPVDARRRLPRVNGVVRYSRGRYAQRVVADGHGLRRHVAGDRPGAPARHRRGRTRPVRQRGRHRRRRDVTGQPVWRLAANDARTGLTRGSAYVMRYDLDLFSNFTYFLDDPVERRSVPAVRSTASSPADACRIAGVTAGRASVGAARRRGPASRRHRPPRAAAHRARAQPLAVTREDQRVADLGERLRAARGAVDAVDALERRAPPRSLPVRRGRRGSPRTAAPPARVWPARRAALIFGPWRADRAVRQCGLWVPLERRAGHDAYGGSRDRRAGRSRHAPGPGQRRGVRRANGAATRPRRWTSPSGGWTWTESCCSSAMPGRRSHPGRAADGAWSGTPTRRRGRG